MGGPSEIAGLRPFLRTKHLPNDFIELICRDYDRACMWHGRWAEARDDATKTVNAPRRSKNSPPQMQVKKYTTLSDVLALGTEKEPEPGAEPATPKPPKLTKAERKAKELLSNPDAMNDFIQGIVTG